MQPNLYEKFGGMFSGASTRNECGNSYTYCLDPSIVSRGVEVAKQMVEEEVSELELTSVAGDVNWAVTDKGASRRSSSKREKNVAEKNSSSHTAKDFLSSINDIEHRFIRPSESSREVLRLLEANKIKVGYFQAKRKLSMTTLLSVFQPICCIGKASPVFQEPAQKSNSWRTRSFQLSASNNALAEKKKKKEYIDDNGSDIVEEFYMIARSHSSTLDRLYAWEQNLYDEVKANQRAPVIDKAQSVAKDLHSMERNSDDSNKRSQEIQQAGTIRQNLTTEARAAAFIGDLSISTPKLTVVPKPTGCWHNKSVVR
ncbi:hypothetical protein CR513_18087, partial [Mucuna pruriens]